MAKPSLNYYQALHVGKVKTDVIQFTSIQSAIDAVTDNAAGKRYAIYVHPGTYTEKITMEDYIDLIAEGGREETIISFTATAHDEATLTGENSMVNGFTIVSDGNASAWRARCVNAATAGFEMEDCILTPQNTAAAAICLNATASCDIRDSVVDSASAATTGTVFTTAGQTYNVERTSFDGGTDAIQVLANVTLTLTDCGVLDNLNIQNGTTEIYRSRVEAVALSTASSTFRMYQCNVTGALTTAAAAQAHAITCVNCSFNNTSITQAATGGTGITLRGCDGINALNNTGALSTITLYDSDVETLTTSAGAVTAYGGRIAACGGSSGTSFIWWKDANFLEILPNMRIADALAAPAASGDVIHISKGTFAESNLAAVNGVDIIGEGWGLSIIETTSVNPIVAIADNITCEIHGVKVSNLGTGPAILSQSAANNNTLTIEDCWFNSSASGIAIEANVTGAGNTTVNARRCYLSANAVNSIMVLGGAGAGLHYFNSWDCTFDTSGGAGQAAIRVNTTVTCDVNVARARFSGCTLAVYSAGVPHTVDIDDSEFNVTGAAAAGIELATGASTITLSSCNDIGTFTHNTLSTVALNQCYLSGVYTIGAVAGVVNAYRTQFSTFTNGGSGAIAFQECNGTDINNNATSTMTIEGGHWDTVLQGAAAGTINIYGAVVATEFDCSAAGAINAYNCDVASIDSNGGTITLYEGDLRAVSDATGVIVWWTAPHTRRVIASTANMKIMDAADAAGAAVGDTILIGPGTFTEALDLDAGINACTYKGFGRERTIITQATGTTVLVDGISNVILEDLTINLTAGVNTNAALKLDSATNASASVTLRNVGITTTWTAGTVYGVWAVDDGAKVGLVLIYDSTITCSGGANSFAVAANTCTTATTLISLYDTIIYGQTYDIYNDRITITTHKCELNGGGWWIQNNATAIGLAMDNENPATVTPVTFAGAAGEFADLTGAELYTCLATVLIGEAVYVSAANTVVEATNAAAAPIPAEGVVVYKPAGAAGTECYVKNTGMAYMATPPAVWAAGTNVWLGVAGAQLVARPTNALKQLLGVGVDTKRMLVNISNVEVVTKVATVPVWPGAGTAPTGTHVNVNSRKAVAIVGAAGQTVFSHAWEVPEDFLALSALKVIVFPTGTGSFDWTAYSSKAASGELENDGSQTATADTQGVTDNTILDHDITAATAGLGLAEGDHFNCDLLVDVLTTITQLLVLGFRVEYSAQRGC